MKTQRFNVRGTLTRSGSERVSQLDTFLAGGVDSCRYICDDQRGTVVVSLTRNLWTTWRGTVTADQFARLASLLGDEKVSRWC